MGVLGTEQKLNYPNYDERVFEFFHMHFFETNHGQSERDSIHILIETAVKRIETIILP